MTDRLAETLAEYQAATAEVAELKERLPKAQKRVRELRPRLAEVIVDDIRAGRRTQAELHRLTGYTPERIRQLCRAAGVESH